MPMPQMAALAALSPASRPSMDALLPMTIAYVYKMH